MGVENVSEGGQEAVQPPSTQGSSRTHDGVARVKVGLDFLSLREPRTWCLSPSVSGRCLLLKSTTISLVFFHTEEAIVDLGPVDSSGLCSCIIRNLTSVVGAVRGEEQWAELRVMLLFLLACTFCDLSEKVQHPVTGRRLEFS